MAAACFKGTLLLSVVFLLCVLSARSADSNGFVSCLRRAGVGNYSTQGSALYLRLLDFSLQNLRFTGGAVAKPGALVFPESKEDVQKAFACSLSNSWAPLVRSGGHSYEGLSSTADVPFVIIDLMNMHAVDVDLQSATAWVEAGATVGEVYYGISQKSSTHGFPGGTCPTLGAGGHFSGGGYGMLSRKYGVAADNVIDAQIIDARGRILDRQSMGEDMFWALRGGGGGVFAIVVAWKIKLVPVPSVITTFNLVKFGREEVAQLVYKWQSVAPFAADELFMSIYITGSKQSGSTTTAATFYGQYFGSLTETVNLINRIFPELGLSAGSCKQGSWIEAVAQIAYLQSVASLSQRFNPNKNYFKAKSDYVTSPISPQALQGAFRFLEENTEGYIILEPYGGIMSRTPSDAIAFPHRAGKLYVVQYQAVWTTQSGNDSYNIDWLRRFYSYMAPYVSKHPRAAYVNYLDLDLGSAENAASWGIKYFLQNFAKLSDVKSRVDPSNTFRNAQSIPPRKNVLATALDG